MVNFKVTKKNGTLPETNIAPKNGGFQQESSGLFSGAMLVPGRVTVTITLANSMEMLHKL